MQLAVFRAAPEVAERVKAGTAQQAEQQELAVLQQAEARAAASVQEARMQHEAERSARETAEARLQEVFDQALEAEEMAAQEKKLRRKAERRAAELQEELDFARAKDFSSSSSDEDETHVRADKGTEGVPFRREGRRLGIQECLGHIGALQGVCKTHLDVLSQ